MMRGRDFLSLAREVVRGNTEAHWRGGVIHAYYGLLLECRDALERWGRRVPHRDVHRLVRLTLVCARDADVKSVGYTLERLGPHRAYANYQMATRPDFSSRRQPRQWVQEAADALALLDAIDGDPARRAAGIASLPPPIP